jgi:hypothetical protein
MNAEFQVAFADGKPLCFAFGCVIAAWRELPRDEPGRFVIANYLLALGVLVPTAALQLACAIRFTLLPVGRAELFAVPTPASPADLYLADAYGSGAAVLLALLIALAGAHLCLAWVLLKGERSAIDRFGALTAAIAVTIVTFSVVLFFGDADSVPQGLFVATELTAVAIAARWRDRLFPEPAMRSFAG